MTYNVLSGTLSLYTTTTTTCAVWWYPSALPCGVRVCVQYGGILVHCVVVFVCVCSTEVS